MRDDWDDDPREFLTIRQPLHWLEFGWLYLVDPGFRATRHKRKAFFDHLLAKRFRQWRY